MSTRGTRERECIECGKSFRGHTKRCALCRAVERVCAECDRTFRGTATRCMTCQAIERVCAECGRTFRGTHSQCGLCQAVERVCVECGVSFQGINASCASCRAIERVCAECGRTFRGTYKRCITCQKIERVCTECGRSFRGTEVNCRSCRRLALPEDIRNAMQIAWLNTRRAHKRDAEIAGPVPAATYAAIRAEGVCVYCGEASEHVDHVRPLSRGGWEHETNLVPACAACNLSKHDRLLTEWRPDRVQHGVLHSAKVAVELDRLTRGGDDPVEDFIPDEIPPLPYPFTGEPLDQADEPGEHGQLETIGAE